MPAPAITFAIPYYSGIDYLGRAIESVLAQADDGWQAVVADDSSEPGVEDLVQRVGRGRVRYVKNPQNLGIDGNFNRCIDLAETELVTVLHADDELMPSYTATMRGAAERYPHAAAVFCRAMIIGPQSESWFSLADFVKAFINPAQREEFVLEGEPGVRALLRANFIMAPTLCFRRSVLGERRFPMGYKFVLDWELTTSLLLDGECLVGIPERCYRYRRHLENATEKLTKTHQRFREESDFYDRMRDKALARGWDKCAALAAEKRIIKLNIAYRALKSAVQLRLGDARDHVLFVRGGAGTGGFVETGADEHLSDIADTSTEPYNHGYGELAALVTDELGYRVEQVVEGPVNHNTPVALASLDLDRYAVIVLGSNNASYPDAAVAAIGRYVDAGGGVLVISDANWGTYWDDAPTSDQAFLTQFGLVMNQDGGGHIEITSEDVVVPDHPILTGVTEFHGEGVSPCTVARGSGANVAPVVVARTQGVVRRNTAPMGPVEDATADDGSLVVVEAGRGRLACHFDRNTFFNTGGAGSSLASADNRTYAANLFGWLAHRR